MYNGIVNMNNLDASEILELLEACDELNFNELVEDLQNHLLIDHKEWIQQNLIYFYKISSKHQTFNLLQGYCNELIDDKPESLLNSNDMVYIEKSMLINILKRILENIIPLIRINQIKYKDFCRKIKPYRNVFN